VFLKFKWCPGRNTGGMCDMLAEIVAK